MSKNIISINKVDFIAQQSYWIALDSIHVYLSVSCCWIALNVGEPFYCIYLCPYTVTKWSNCNETHYKEPIKSTWRFTCLTHFQQILNIKTFMKIHRGVPIYMFTPQVYVAAQPQAHTKLLYKLSYTGSRYVVLSIEAFFSRGRSFSLHTQVIIVKQKG